MRTVIGVATSVAAVQAIDTKPAEEAAACSSDQKKSISDSLMTIANSKISDNSKDTQYLSLLTKDWATTKTALLAELPTYADATLDNCRREHMSYFLELFARRKIQLTEYPQVKEIPTGGSQQQIALPGKPSLRGAAAMGGQPSLAQTQAQMGTNTQRLLASVPDFTKEMMKRRTNQNAMITGLQATMAGMANMDGGEQAAPMAPQMQPLPSAVEGQMDDKITSLLAMGNATDLSLTGELSSLVSGLSSELSSADSLQINKPKSETEMLLEKLEAGDEDALDQAMEMGADLAPSLLQQDESGEGMPSIAQQLSMLSGTDGANTLTPGQDEN